LLIFVSNKVNQKTIKKSAGIKVKSKISYDIFTFIETSRLSELYSNVSSEHTLWPKDELVSLLVFFWIFDNVIQLWLIRLTDGPVLFTNFFSTNRLLTKTWLLDQLSETNDV
jgi:hypothetical protein